MSNHKLQSAISMAKLGFPILPLKSNEKTPAIINWQSHACQSEEQISGWAKDFPNCNFGIKTGKGIIVLDVDNKNAKNGSDALAAMGQIPLTFTVSTPSGGFHYYFRTTENLRNSTSKEGLDIRADGGLVVCPGSIVDEKEYQVINDVPLAELPEWLIEKLGSTKASYPVEIEYPESLSQEWSDEKRDALESHLSFIDPDLPYEAWLVGIYAAINIYGYHSDVFESLNQWSANGVKYDEAEFWKKIKSYNPNHLYKAGFTTLAEIKWKYPRKSSPILSNSFGVQLESPLFNKAVDILKLHGNTPSPQHERALSAICKTLANGIDSDEKFRIAFPLETGMGKTTCVVALAYALQPYDKSLLICAERIEQLQEMKDAMVEAGVDESKIGIYHSKKDTDIPSVEFKDLKRCKFLLVSHARVVADSKSGNCSNLLNYEGSPRSMTIWDESLITTESFYCSLSDMRCALQDWIARFQERLHMGQASFKHNEEYHKLRFFFMELKDSLEQEEVKDGMVIQLPYLSAGGISIELINTIVNNESYRNALRTLINFVQLGEVRIVKVKDGFSVMHFATVIDDSFDKIVVMDASARIKTLLNFDQSISINHLEVSKDYADVKICHANVKSSKDSFKDKNHLKNYLQEITYLINTKIPKNEELIIFCHKENKDEIRGWATSEYPLRTINVLNWGEHKATNKYKHVKYVITCGNIYREWQEISTSIIGQTRTLNYTLLDADASETFYSEQAEMFYQGFSRGNCRNTIDGKAGEQTIYLFHPTPDYLKVMDSLRKVMPNVIEETYKPQYLTEGRKDAKDHQEIARKITDYLTSLALDMSRVTKTHLLRCIAPHLSSNSKTWRKAIDQAQQDLKGWMFGGVPYFV